MLTVFPSPGNAWQVPVRSVVIFCHFSQLTCSGPQTKAHSSAVLLLPILGLLLADICAPLDHCIFNKVRTVTFNEDSLGS